MSGGENLLVFTTFVLDFACDNPVEEKVFYPSLLLLQQHHTELEKFHIFRIKHYDNCLYPFMTIMDSQYAIFVSAADICLRQ